MRSRRRPRDRRRTFPPSRGWRAWFSSVRQSLSRRRQASRERASQAARADTQYHRLKAHHERFLAAFRDRESGNLRRMQAFTTQPEAALQTALRRLALEGPDSDAWVAIARARLESGQASAGLEAAAEAVRLGQIPAAALAAMAEHAAQAAPVARIFKAEHLPPDELGELFQTMRGWPNHRVLRHLLLHELFHRVEDHEERARLTELGGLLPDGSRAELEAAVAEAWREMAGQPTFWDSDTVLPQEVWLHDTLYDWAPALQARLPNPDDALVGWTSGVRFTQRPAAFDAGSGWARRRCRQYLLGKDPGAPQSAPQALPLLRRLHSEGWRLVGFEVLAEAWPSPGGSGDARLGDLLGAARRFGSAARRARCLFRVSGLLQAADAGPAAACWDEARQALDRLPPDRQLEVLPAAVAGCLGARQGAELERLLAWLTRLDAEGAVAALLGALTAPDSPERARLIETLTAGDAAARPAVAYLLSWERGDLPAQAAALEVGWASPTEASAVPWASLALATCRASQADDAALLSELAATFGRRCRRGDAAAAAPWLAFTVRSEQLDGRPDAPASRPVLTEAAMLQGDALDAAIVAIAACSDGAGPGWLRAVEESFLRRLERTGASAAMGGPQLDMLLETLAHAQVAARVRGWMDGYTAGVEAWLARQPPAGP